MREGSDFEYLVYSIYTKMKSNVAREVKIKKKKNHLGKGYVVFDICYGFPFKHLVECKYRSNGVIEASDIMKFVGDMEAVGLPSYRGEFVTNTTYSPQAVDYARRHKIKLIDGIRLKQLYYKYFTKNNRDLFSL